MEQAVTLSPELSWPSSKTAPGPSPSLTGCPSVKTHYRPLQSTAVRGSAPLPCLSVEAPGVACSHSAPAGLSSPSCEVSQSSGRKLHSPPPSPLLVSLFTLPLGFSLSSGPSWVLGTITFFLLFFMLLYSRVQT